MTWRSRLLTVLALLLLALPAASPYLRPDVPRTNDLFPHLFRTLALDRVVRLGYLWPAWSPDLVHGYGYPVFYYFPSLSHWSVELFHLAGLALTTAYRAATVSHFFLAAAGAFALGRAVVGGQRAGWGAAVVYTYSPYLLYDAHVRGALPETVALVLLPWVTLALWQAGRCHDRAGATSGPWIATAVAVCRDRAPWIVVGALLFLAMFLSHPVSYQLLTPLGLWLALLAWWRGSAAGDRTGRLRAAGWALLGPALLLTLGALLTAFQLLPAVRDVDFTRAFLSISQGYTYEANFLPWEALWRWPPVPADPALVNPPVVRSLPWPVLPGIALSLALTGRRLRRRPGQQLLAWLAVLLLATWLATPAAAPLWSRVRLLQLMLYPWRFLSLAGLATAMLAALALSCWDGRRADWASAGLTLLVVVSAVPWLYPPREPVAEAPDLADLAATEMPPLLIGTTTLGEFLPLWVEALPQTDEMKAALIQGGQPDRLVVPATVTATRLTADPLDAVYRLEVADQSTLIYRQFYFPAWSARLDGRPLPLSPTTPDGLISLPVPAGHHELRLTFGRTASQRQGLAISLAALAAAGLCRAGSLWPRVAGRRPGAGPRQSAGPDHQVGSRTVIPAGARDRELVFLGGLVLAAWLVFTLVDNPLRRPTLGPEGILGRPAVEPRDFAGELRLLSYEPVSGSMSAADPFQLTLYWQPLRPIGVTYDISVRVVDEDGLIWSDGDAERPYDWRFVAGPEPWPLNGYRLDPYQLRLLDGTPPGRYRFSVGLVRRDTGATMAEQQLGELRVTAPARSAPPARPGVSIHDVAAGGLRLSASQLDRREARPGDPLRLATVWQVEMAGAAPALHYSLVDETGGSVWTAPVSLATDYPATNRSPGDRLRADGVWRLPADLAGGRYRWQVHWAGQIVDLASIQIREPARRYTAPGTRLVFQAELGQIAGLVGANLEPGTGSLAPGDALGVELVWVVRQETAISYKVFVHLRGEDGRVLAQSDGEPAGWDRPTTSWLPGEYIVDAHRLTLPAALPAGRYQLVTGFYEPASGRRLVTPGGQDVVLLGQVTVGP